MANDLIQCGRHGMWAPWSIVCVHLMEGQSRQWQAVPSNAPEVDFDWLCPSCLEKHNRGQDVLDLSKAVCMHCVRVLRKRYDPNYQEES